MTRVPRNTWAEIDLDQLDRNMEVLQNHVGPGVKLAPVIKADAYGHGAVAIARELSNIDVAYLAVAILLEAIELRDNGIQAPILVMGYTDSADVGLAVEKNITLTIFDYDQALLVSNEAKKRNVKASVHIKVDTGFHRLGKTPSPEFADEIVRMSKLDNLSLKGIFSHLRLATEEGDERQRMVFCEFIDELKERGVSFDERHISDSIAAVKYSKCSMDMVRPGAIIYGYLPKSQLGRIDVKPIMTFKTRVARLQQVSKGDGIGYDESFEADRDMMVATLPVGYADGYTRYLSRKGEVLIRGKRAKVLGIICMDQMMVDVTHIDSVAVGDEVVLFGPGEADPTVDELAALTSNNKNAIISGITRRVPRVYIKNGRVAQVLNYLARPEEKR